MADETSVRHRLPFLAAGQAQKELTLNEALALIDFGMNATAVAAGINAPPPTPIPGQCWIIGPAPIGAWTGQANAIACWTTSGWRFLPGIAGMQVWLEGQQLHALYTAGSWAVGDVRCGRLLIGGDQVVGARRAAVATPAGGSVVDTEARTALTQLVDRLVAHGLIYP